MIIKWWHVAALAVIVLYGGVARYCDVKESLGYECRARCR